MNKPLIILGTPFGGCFEYAHELRGDFFADQQRRFTSLHDELYGSVDHEVEALPSLTTAPPTNLPEFRDSIRELLSEVDTLGGAMILTDTRLIGTSGVIASEISNASFLVFVESPRSMLARTLDKVDPDQLIENWIQSAKSILALAHRFRSRVTLLVAQECLEHPSAFQAYLRGELGLDTDHPYPRHHTPAAVETAIETALSELILSKNQQLSRLYLEILAISHPLAHTSSDLQDAECDPRDAIREIISLRNNHAKIAAERDAQKAKLENLEKSAVEKEVLSKQLQSSKDQIKHIEESKKELSEENELLLQQLHQVQEELEETFLQKLQTEKELDNQRETLAAERDVLKAKIEKLEKAAGEKESLTKQLQSCKDQIKSIEESKKDISEENELMLLQLHQVQEELEHYFLEARRLKKNAKQHHSEALGIWEYGSFAFGEVREESPHRHLNFTLDETKSRVRIFRNIRLRLLEHHGRPGILLFQPQGDQTSPLHHWQQSGEEGGVPYMILIPQDQAGADFLVAATTSDLLFIRGILRLLRSQLGDDSPNKPLLTPWIRVAGRLLEQIDDLPERLHYDSVSCELTSGEKSWDCTFVVSNAWFLGHGVAELSANWSSTNYASMTLRYSGSEAPLSIWPLDPKGMPERELSIDLSNSASLKDKAARFTAMTKRERAFLHHLVAEFPNFLVHMQNQHPDSGLNLNKLNKQALSFMKLVKKTFPQRLDK